MPTQQEIDAQRAATAAVSASNASTAAKPQPVAQPAVMPTVTKVDAQGNPSPVGRALTGTPAYNPYTGGAETVNPEVGVNTQQYSLQEKAALAKSKGYDLAKDKVSINDFQRNPDGSLGFKLPEKVAGQVAQAPNSQTTPTGPVQGTNVTGAMNVGLDQQMQEAANQGDALEQKKGEIAQKMSDAQNAITAASELAKGTSIADAIKSTQETKAAQEKINALQAENAKIAADANIRSAKDAHDGIVQTHSYLAGALGQPVSMAGLNGVKTEIDRTTQHFNDVVTTSQNLEAARKIGDAEAMKGYTQKIADLQKQLNSEVSASIQQALVNIGKLDQMGDLQSPEAIVRARTEELAALGNKYDKLTTTTAAQLKVLNDSYKQQWDMQQDKAAVDYNLSNKTGQMVNKFGEPVLVGGKPVTIPKDKQVHSSQMINGNMVTVFQDGTTQTTKAYDVTQFGDIDLDKTAKMGPVTGYVYDSKGNVAVSPDGKPLKYSPEAVYDIVKNSDGTVVYHNKQNPKDSFATDSFGAVTAVNGVPVPKRTEIRSDDYDVAESAADVPVGTKGGECTVFARKQLEKNGKDAWINEGLPSAEADTVEWKAGKTNTSVPSIGSLVAMNNGTRYGHWGVVTGIGSDGTISYTSSNERGDQKVTNNSFKAGDPSVLGYYNPNLPKKAAGLAGGDRTLEQEYADKNLETRIVKAASGTSSGKDEREAARRKVEIGRKLGKSDMEIMNDAAGFTIDKDKAELGNQAANAMIAAGVTPSTSKRAQAISANINSGNLKGAASNIESEAFNSENGKAIKIADEDADYVKLYRGYTRIEDLLEKNKDKVGVLSGRWEDVKKKLAGDKDLQELQANITATFADLRKNFAGSAVTDTEMKALENYINGTTKEPIENLQAKLMTVMQKMDDQYQAKRRQVGLPELTDNSQVDDRSTLYFNEKGSTSDSSQPSAQGKVYKTDKGEYTLEQIKQQLSERLGNGESKTDLKKWLQDNNIPVK